MKNEKLTKKQIHKIEQQQLNKETYDQIKKYKNDYEIDICEYVLKVLYSKSYFEKCLNEAILKCHLAGRKALEDIGTSYYEMYNKYRYNEKGLLTMSLIPKYNKDLWKVYEQGFDKQWFEIEYHKLYAQDGIYKNQENKL